MRTKSLKNLIIFGCVYLFFFSFLNGKENSTGEVDFFLTALMDTQSLSRPYYEHYDISPNGKWVAFSIARGFKEDDIYPRGDLRRLPGRIPVTFLRQDIWIASTTTGKITRLTNGKPDKRSFWHPSWAPNSRDLAFYGDSDGRIALWICRNATIPGREVTSFPTIKLKSTLFRRDIPRWTQDGKKLIIPLLPKSEENDSPGIDDNPLYLIPKIYQKFLDPKGGATSSVLRYDDPDDTSRFMLAENRVDLGIVDITSGEMKRITDDLNVLLWELSPDRKFLAFKLFKKMISGTYNQIFDLYAIPSEGSTPRLLAENVQNEILWSKDGVHLLERQNEELFVVDVNGNKKQITPGEDQTFEKVLPPPDILRTSASSYIWSPDGKSVLAQNKSGWWQLSFDGDAPKRIFATKNEKTEERISGILRAKYSGYAFSPDGQSVILETFDPTSSRKNLLGWDLQKDRLVPLAENIPNYSYIFDIFKNKSHSYILYSHREREIDNLWFSDLNFSSPKRFTDLNPHLKQIPRGRKELFNFRNLDGQELKGALLFPRGYEEGKTHPMVVYVYAGSSITTLERAFPLTFSAVSSIPQLLSQCGYLVMRPSIPLGPVGTKGSPLKMIPESVLPAVDKVVAMGIADSDRIGVIGQSYGGYTVNVLITQTNRFKSAVALAGLSDLISNYGIFDARRRYNTGGSATFSSWAEGGQGRMGVPPWDDRLQWIENSPIYFLNRVESPLLLLHGDLDFVSLAQAEQMFSGLKRLKKEVEFVRYFGEGHVLSKPVNIRDSWQRIVAWFDKHLKPDY